MRTRLPGLDWPQRLGTTLWGWAVAWGRILHLGAVMLVLLLSPSSYGRPMRRRLAWHLVATALPGLPGFAVLAALISLVLTRIVVVTADSYGLSRYALEMVIRVLVIELIPLTAALFVAMRSTIPAGTQLASLRATGHLDALRERGADVLRLEVLPRVVAGIFACCLLAAVSGVVALVLAYLGVYGFTLAGLPGYTRMFGQVFTPPATLLLVGKTLAFSLAVALTPVATALDARRPGHPGWELGGLARMFAVLLLIELASLVGHYI
ncbi:ABC transporter permease [Acidovorax lacteus]|uniref:ABC transporter permease n=1 Tax=Acidovorax lacteus TaxID=1924988 RepID=A0ABP8L112_9BURK